MMRIITGSARGIRLKTLDGEATRPTAERVKEAVFSKIQFDIESRSVLDLFSGSGQLALEALSRGAKEAILIDNSADAIKIIKENAEKTKLSALCQIYNVNALDFIRRNCGKRFDIVFIDPPYASKLYFPILDALYTYDILKPSTILICESDYDFFDEALLAKYEIIKRAQYGKIIVNIIKPIFKEK